MPHAKVSPTVKKTYKETPKWFGLYAGENKEYDPEGYNLYGYDENGIDREGISEIRYNLDVKLFLKKQAEWNDKPTVGSPEYLRVTIKELELKNLLESEKFQKIPIESKEKVIELIKSF